MSEGKFGKRKRGRWEEENGGKGDGDTIGKKQLNVQELKDEKWLVILEETVWNCKMRTSNCTTEKVDDIQIGNNVKIH